MYNLKSEKVGTVCDIKIYTLVVICQFIVENKTTANHFILN